MKLNWKPKRVAFLDFETRSQADLDTVHRYATHPSTQVLTCVVKTDDGIMRKYGPFLSDADKQELTHIAKHHTIVAHNAPFDAAVWEHVAKLPEAEWFDTLPCARAAGLPGKLDDLSKIITGRGKDPHGRRLIDLLCLSRSAYPPVDSPAYALLMQYNLRDVEELEQIYDRVKDFVEPDVMTVDRTINDRGIPVCAPFLEQLRALYEWNNALSNEHFEKVTEDPETGLSINPASPKQVTDWLRRIGFNVPNINKVTWRALNSEPEKFFDGGPDEDAAAATELMQEMLRLRREIVRVGKSKVDKALSLIEADGRIREQMVYWGAHTGRWSGRALQVHNMPAALRQAFTRDMELTKESVTDEVERLKELLGSSVHVTDVLNTSIRHMVRSPVGLLVADYGAVELRGVAWLAGEEKVLEILSNPSASIYSTMGERLFGQYITKADPERYTFCKALVLGCGYGMSGAKFDWMLRFRSLMRTETLDAMGVDPRAAVQLFRETFPAIPQLWRDMDTAAKEAVRGCSTVCGKCTLYMEGPDLHVVLPSERHLVYRNARIEQRVPKYAAVQGKHFFVDTIVYDHPRKFAGQLYGGLLVENVTQAMCRDFLAFALVSLEQTGLTPTLHVHDEIVCESKPERFAEMMEIMSTPPPWANGFPLLVEGYAGNVWTKQTKGYTEKVYMSGREVKR